MELVLLRHGKAAPHGHPQGDAARALEEKGRTQARRAAGLLKEAGLLPEIVLTSPLLRARQTAEEFCQVAGMPGPLVQPWLALGADPAAMINELRGFVDFKRVAIVGHEPDFSGLVEWLLRAEAGTIDFKKGAIAALRVTPPLRVGTLLYLVPPRIVPGAAADGV